MYVNLTTIEKWGKFFVDADDRNMKDYVSKIARSEEGIMNATQILQWLNTDYSMWTAQEHHDNAIREREMLILKFTAKKYILSCKNLFGNDTVSFPNASFIKRSE